MVALSKRPPAPPILGTRDAESQHVTVVDVTLRVLKFADFIAVVRRSRIATHVAVELAIEVP